MGLSLVNGRQFSSGVNGVSALHNFGLEGAEANGDNPLHGAVAKHNLKQPFVTKLIKTLSHLSVAAEALKSVLGELPVGQVRSMIVI